MTIQATYEHGVLKPKAPLELKEGETVEIVALRVVPTDAPVNGDSVADALLEIAALPVEGSDDGFSGTDHDSILYPKRGQVP